MPERQAWFLAFATMLLGASLGFAAHALGTRDRHVPVEVIPAPAEAELDAAELEALCEDLRASDVDLIAAAQGQVDSLRSTLDTREAELAALREQVDEAEDAAAAKQRRILALEKEIASTRTALTSATEERDRLVTELRETLAALDEQVLQTENAEGRARAWRARSTDSLWRSFVAESKVRICARGTVKRLDRCQDAVEQALARHRTHFERCVMSYQATPTLGQLEGKDARAPATAETLPDEKVYPTKGWFLDFCDESLPEAGGL
ncbi:MAG: hypothetical protein H6732_14950 [Alphaproteobacteria bacterium]|nr:hypothetical protein [Alphaproteobacteria bacterium]